MFDQFGLAIDPDRAVHTLSVGEKQRVGFVSMQETRVLSEAWLSLGLTPVELFRGEGLDLVRSTLLRYMLPYFVVLVAYLTAKRNFDLPSLLFVSTFVDDRASTFLQPFWFIEVFFQIALVLAGLFAIRPLREAVEVSRDGKWAPAEAGELAENDAVRTTGKGSANVAIGDVEIVLQEDSEVTVTPVT